MKIDIKTTKPEDINKILHQEISSEYPPYWTSADAAISLLETWEHNRASRWVDGLWLVGVSDDPNQHVFEFLGYAELFSHAACIAMLRARGIEVID